MEGDASQYSIRVEGYCTGEEDTALYSLPMKGILYSTVSSGRGNCAVFDTCGRDTVLYSISAQGILALCSVPVEGRLTILYIYRCTCGEDTELCFVPVEGILVLDTLRLGVLNRHSVHGYSQLHLMQYIYMHI